MGRPGEGETAPIHARPRVACEIAPPTMAEGLATTFGTALRKDAGYALVGLVSAALPLVFLRGFTVDDALIIARYAANVAAGEGHRFHPSADPSDGVTPFGLAYLMAPLAREGVLAGFYALRAVGVIAWLFAAAALGIAVGRASSHPLRFASLLLVATSAPLAAWSIAGLETGLATAFATLAVVLPRGLTSSLVGALFAGLVAWLRPEALPFALVLGAGRGHALARARPAHRRRAAYAQPLLLAASPFVLVAVARVFLWGSPLPLSALAKPSDFTLGLKYALACALLTGGPIAAFAPEAFRKLDAYPRFVLLAGYVHFGAVALAGGDWMPLSRLVVPALPAFVYVTAHLLSTPKPAIPLARLGLALVGTLFVLLRVGPVAARVLDDRLALVESAREALVGLDRVASVDIGWLGAATQAPIIDLAGVTDPEIAALPGGHTSKTISPTMLARRDVDAVLLLDPPRIVEARLLRDPDFTDRYAPTWQSPPDLPVKYVLWRRNP